MKYEYKHSVLPYRARECVDELNKLGSEGWEVMTIIFGVNDDNQVWLKRATESKDQKR